MKRNMATVIYPSPIFGPVHSRRLGVSLGINLLPADGKVCTFDCIYCECGFNAQRRPKLPLPTREEVRQALETRLQQMQTEGPVPDVLTFAGNGEPTAHPHFPEIIDDTLELRDRYFNALAACTEVVNAAYEKTVGCEFKAYLEAINEADTVIAVFDPDNPRCEREAAAVAVAEMLNRQVITADPKAIRLF